MPDTVRPSETASWRKLFPFQSQWLKLPAGSMHFLDERATSLAANGYERVLLFVHGNPTWSFHWRNLIAGLKANYRCLAPDHLGCGLSSKLPNRFTLDDHVDHLHQLVTELDLENVTLIAQDWGGAIGLAAMLRAPQRLSRIVLFNTGAFTPRYIPWRIRACRLPMIGQLAVQGGNVFSRAALRMTLSRRARLDPAVAAGYLAPYDSWSNRRAVYEFVRDIPSGPGHATWATLADIERRLPTLADRPALLVWGMRDWCFRPDCLERFLSAWPRAEAHRLENVGHWVVEDAPDESLELVQRFLAKTEGAHREGREVPEKINTL